MATTTTVTVDSKRYQDQDDCLAAAAAEYAAEHGLEGWDLSPRWVGGDDGNREEIELTVPGVRDSSHHCDECGAEVTGDACEDHPDATISTISSVVAPVRS